MRKIDVLFLTGVDLVELMIRVAAGEKLDILQVPAASSAPLNSNLNFRKTLSPRVGQWNVEYMRKIL